MRRTILSLSIMALATISAANAEVSDIKLRYDKGTIIEAPSAGFDMKLNFQLQTRYSYQQYDKSELFGLEDVNEFVVRRARINAEGNVLNKQFTFKLQNDFVGKTDDEDRRTSDLKDAYIQWNADPMAKLRLGQFKVPYSAQELVSSTSLQFIERAIATDEFAPAREGGAMASGTVAEGLNYYLSVHNGESDGEGLNRYGQDTDVLGAAMLSYAQNYDRSYEGDLKPTNGIGCTGGLAATHESGTRSEIDFDATRIGADFGLRTAGLSLQAEIYYRTTDLDDNDETMDDLGYYAQAGYFVVPEKWELAGRFSAVQLDKDFDNTDIFEYAIVVNRYILGHYLKVQTGVTIEQYDFPEAEPDQDSTDVRFDLQLAGYF